MSQASISARWHPYGRGSAAGRVALEHLVDAAPRKRERGDDPLTAGAAEALPGEAADGGAAAGSGANEAALELAALKRGAHPRERLHEDVRAFGRLPRLARRCALARRRVRDSE